MSHHPRIFTWLLLCFILSPTLAMAEDEEEDKEEEGEVISERVISRKVVSRKVVKKSKKKRSKRSRKKKVTRKTVRVVQSEPARRPAASKPAQKSTSATPAPKKAATATIRPVSTQDEAQVTNEVTLPEPKTNPWSIRAEAITDAPLQIGAGLLLETPARFRLKTSAGALSQTYLSATSSLAGSLNETYPQEAADMLQDSLQSSFVWRSGIGMRPFRRLGLYGHIGYTMLRMRGETSGEKLAGAIQSIEGYEAIGEAMSQYGPEQLEYASVVHLADGELGWEFTPGEHFALRLGLGWSSTMNSTSTVTALFDSEDETDREQIEQFEENGAITMDAIFENFFHPPTLHMGLGFRF